MSGQPSFSVRRATVDDLGALVEIWGAMQFDVSELERRLTEFQAAVAEDGRVLGAVGLELMGNQGLVHHEAFADFALADAVREALWVRLQKVAENNGVSRVWTCETAPFWNHNGFLPPPKEALELLPAGFDPNARWLMTKLREEAEQPKLPVEEEFEKFLAAERQKTERLAQHAKTMKTMATLIAALLFLGVMALAVYYIMHRPE